MALPNQLKNLNVYADGNSLMGVIEEVALPKLARKMETFQGGGMVAPVDIDIGLEKLELSLTCGGGYVLEILKQFGLGKANGALIRYAGAYQRDDTGDVAAVEIVTRGRYSEIDFGSAKVGDKSTVKANVSLSYYKLVIDGTVIIEVDALAFIYIVNGVDMLDKQRKAIGLA